MWIKKFTESSLVLIHSACVIAYIKIMPQSASKPSHKLDFFFFYWCIHTIQCHTVAQSEVLSLQELCIDCVAECLHSPKDVESLSLPTHTKEKIVKVVFDPQIDSCCNPQDLTLRDMLDRKRNFTRIFGSYDMALQKGHVTYYFRHFQLPISRLLLHRLKINIFDRKTFRM